MSAHPTETERPCGAACAAALSAALGLLALSLAHVLSEVSSAFKAAMQTLGNLWMPGAAGIGPYSGKETIALLVWLISWAILHAIWKRHKISVGRTGTVALLVIGIATTLVWPPMTELFVHH